MSGRCGAADFRYLEIDRFKFKLARFDLGQIEDIVQERQQGFAGTLNGFDAAALFVGKRAVVEQSRHAENAVHRGPDLMTHAREEQGFCPVGLAHLIDGVLHRASHQKGGCPYASDDRHETDRNDEKQEPSLAVDRGEGRGPVLADGDVQAGKGRDRLRIGDPKLRTARYAGKFR